MKDEQANVGDILVKTLNGAVNKAQLGRLFKELVAFVKDAKLRLDERYDALKADVDKKVESLTKRVSQTKDELSQGITAAKKEAKDADAKLEARFDEKIAGVRSDFPDMPSMPDLTPLDQKIAEVERKIPEAQTGEDFRNALEALPDGDKLAISAIQGLPEALEDVRKRSFGGSAGGGVNMQAFSPMHEAFTMDGIATTITLSAGVGAQGNALFVRYQGQLLDIGTQFTVNGNKITLVGFTPEADTIISVTYWP